MGGKIRSAISNGQLGALNWRDTCCLVGFGSARDDADQASAFDAKYEAGLAPRAAWRRPPSAMRRPIRGLAPVGRSTTSRRSNWLADRQSLS
jgi:hypothetical protein